MLLAITIMALRGPGKPNCHPFFPFNYLQRLSTWKVLTTLKRLELVIHCYRPNLHCGEVDVERGRE